MDNHLEVQNYTYDWNQSHDQATVLLKVPYETLEEDIMVVVEGSYLLAGVRDQPPLIKGRLYERVDPNSGWQLEMRKPKRSARERTTSTTSTTSTRSSYALVSDSEISSSFAASLEGGQLSDAEEATSFSSTLSSPAPTDERGLPSSCRTRLRTQSNVATSRSGSPGFALRSMASSSMSSIESLHSIHSGRLLTLHLEKEHPAIWPSLIVGPVPETESPVAFDPSIYNTSYELEHQYNMDATSLVMLALDLSDIRDDKEEAFEYFIRAWRRAHLPTATIRLAKDYFPLQTPFEQVSPEEHPQRGSHAYNFQCIGGAEGLAHLYLELGLLHLDGAASKLLSSSRSTLSSITITEKPHSNEAEAWKRDREAASQYFKRAKSLQPGLEVPLLPTDGDGLLQGAEELEMPSIGLHPSSPGSVYSAEDLHTDADPPLPRRRRKKEELILLHDPVAKGHNNVDSSWYLHIPSLVGAGTALLVVGVVGALSFSTWRRGQS